MRHILDLKKNLLSVGSLEARGYKFSDADEGMKITKGSITILKGEWTSNLYKMTWSIIIGDTSTATNKEDTARL